MNWAFFTKVHVCIGALLGCLAVANATNPNPDDRRITLDPGFERFMLEKRALAKQLGEQHERFPSHPSLGVSLTPSKRETG